MTVTGPVAPGDLGATLGHEHLYVDLSAVSGREDNVVTDARLVAEELKYLRAAGGRTVVEVTPEGVGRDPVKLREISEASGVTVVSGIAFYAENTHPAWVRGASVGRIADYFVRQIEEGAGGVRAGVIGELFSHNGTRPAPGEYRLDELETRVFRAAAQAQRRTGVGLTTHASLGRGGHAQLDVLEAAGADLRRVCVGHCDAHWHEGPDEDLAYYLPILERRAFCGFDLVGWTELAPDEVRADRVAALARLGYAERLLLATDTCRRSHLRAFGGRGFDFLWADFLPRLRRRGVTEAQIEAMLVTAPRRLLAGG
jgi:phosphotriesterase-related protein